MFLGKTSFILKGGRISLQLSNNNYIGTSYKYDTHLQRKVENINLRELNRNIV